MFATGVERNPGPPCRPISPTQENDAAPNRVVSEMTYQLEPLGHMRRKVDTHK